VLTVAGGTARSRLAGPRGVADLQGVADGGRPARADGRAVERVHERDQAEATVFDGLQDWTLGQRPSTCSN